MTNRRIPYKIGHCPKCHAEVSQRFSLAQVRADGDRLEFYCGACGHAWKPTAPERLELFQFLENEKRRGDIS